MSEAQEKSENAGNTPINEKGLADGRGHNVHRGDDDGLPGPLNTFQLDTDAHLYRHTMSEKPNLGLDIPQSNGTRQRPNAANNRLNSGELLTPTPSDHDVEMAHSNVQPAPRNSAVEGMCTNFLERVCLVRKFTACARCYALQAPFLEKWKAENRFR